MFFKKYIFWTVGRLVRETRNTFYTNSIKPVLDFDKKCEIQTGSQMYTVTLNDGILFHGNKLLLKPKNICLPAKQFEQYNIQLTEQ